MKYTDRKALVIGDILKRKGTGELLEIQSIYSENDIRYASFAGLIVPFKSLMHFFETPKNSSPYMLYTYN